MKILHITYHAGCAKNIEYICKTLGHNLETQFANWNYNIGFTRSNEIYNKYKDYYNSFDLIITSDTAPLSRILLQNKHPGKVIVQVCNRFDYADMATNDCKFPDPEYYKLFNNYKNLSNVKVYSYTKVEYEYARKYRAVDFGDKILKPCAFIDESEQTLQIDKPNTFFIPPYHNDTIFMNLKTKCDELGINAYNGRYNGPKDLENIRGLIHIPYAWSNLALFENWTMGNVYFIPSKDFLVKLSEMGDFFWSPPFDISLLESSEWYLPEHKDLFIYFNNWNELKNLSTDIKLINSKKAKILEFMKFHTEKTLNDWKIAFEEW